MMLLSDCYLVSDWSVDSMSSDCNLVSDWTVDSMNLSNPAISTEVDAPQPSIFEGKLKGYQLKVSDSAFSHEHHK